MPRHHGFLLPWALALGSALAVSSGCAAPGSSSRTRATAAPDESAPGSTAGASATRPVLTPRVVDAGAPVDPRPPADDTSSGFGPAGLTVGAGEQWLFRLSLAAEAISAGQPRVALPLLEEAREQDDGSPIVWFLHGVASLHVGDLTAARYSLKRAVRLEPDDVASRNVLARVHYELGEHDQAVFHLTAATEVSPEDSQSWTSLGLLHVEGRRWVEGYEALMTAITLEPDEVEAHRGLGLLFAAVGELDRAEQAYRQARMLAPESLPLTLGLAHVLRDQGQGVNALELYLEAARREPAEPIHAANVGTTLFELDRFLEAREYLERALMLDAAGSTLDASWVHLTLARALEQLGDVDGAVIEYEAALDADPTLGAAHEALGLIAADRGAETEAIEHLRTAFKVAGLSPSTVVELVLLLERRGERDEARECVSLLKSLDTDDPEVAFRLAQLQVRSSDPEIHDPVGATRVLGRLLRVELSRDAAAWNLMAEGLALQGRYEQALSAIDRALEATDPEAPTWTHYQEQRAHYVSEVPRR